MREILKDYKIFKIDPARLRSPGFFGNMLEYRKAVMDQNKNAIKKNGFKCILCHHGEGQEFLTHKNYILFECRKCGAVSPNINFSKINEKNIYDDPACVKDTIREVVSTYDYRKKTYAPERLDYVLEKTGLKPKQIKLLDIGCGPGYFISHLKDKKIYYKGIELADFLVDFCRKKGLNVEKAEVKNEPDRFYNVITLFDVLEHLVKPLEFMSVLSNKLTPGGYVIAYVPNIHSLAYYLMGEYQNTLVPFQHVCFYDQRSLTYLARKTGFEIRSVDYYGLDLIDYLYMKDYQDKVGYHQKLKDLIPVLQSVIDKQKISNHMRVLFQKK